MLSRREALAALASAAALPYVMDCAQDHATAPPPESSEAEAQKLLGSLADNLLTLQPDHATSLGLRSTT